MQPVAAEVDLRIPLALLRRRLRREVPEVRPAAQQAAQVSQGGREEGNLETRRRSRESVHRTPTGSDGFCGRGPTIISEVTIRSLVTELKPDVQ